MGLQLVDWLFALEGPAPPLNARLPPHHLSDRQHLLSHQTSFSAATQPAVPCLPEPSRVHTAGSLALPLSLSKEDLCWHSSFRSLHIQASSKESRSPTARCAAADPSAAASAAACDPGPAAMSSSWASTPFASSPLAATAGPLRSVKVRCFLQPDSSGVPLFAVAQRRLAPNA